MVGPPLFYVILFAVADLHDVFIQLLVEQGVRQRFGIAHYDELHPCPRYGNVHSPQVAEKAYLSLIVGAYKRYDNDVALLTLESVNGVY